MADCHLPEIPTFDAAVLGLSNAQAAAYRVQQQADERRRAAADDERRAVQAWAKGIRDGCTPALVARLIRRWVEGTDDFRAKAFR